MATPTMTLPPEAGETGGGRGARRSRRGLDLRPVSAVVALIGLRGDGLYPLASVRMAASERSTSASELAMPKESRA